MKFLIISHVNHTLDDGKIYGYGPYVKEMNLWLKYVDKVRIVAPLHKGKANAIDLAYHHDNIQFDKVPLFNLLNVTSKIKTVLILPYVFFRIILAMKWAEHIHIRCPGNMGLLGSIAQIFFPWKIKTVKYAGNWDPNSHQPLTYRLQKSIISNVHFSKKMSVLAYGQWENQSSNVLNFFTATYKENEKTEVYRRSFKGRIQVLFIGALSPGKRPMIAVEAIKILISKNVNIYLDILGEGNERDALENYINENTLNEYICLHGNKNADFVKEKLKEAHFLVLMSKSEGWPKVVAEAMFWGCVPITTNVSCVDYMIGNGSRGALVKPTASAVSEAIEKYLSDEKKYDKASSDALSWSRQFTLESFEEAIKGVLNV